MTTPERSRTFGRLACGSPDHGSNRRQFLLGGAATALGMSLGGLEAGYNPLLADELKTRKKRVLLLWLAGGASQLETWDPKPGVSTGGPFNAISTSVPGVQISELLPKLAQLQHHTALIRSLDTKIGDHGGAADLMDVGRTKEPGINYPDFGTVISKELETRDSDVPDYVSLYLATEGRRRPNPGFLGGRYAAMHLDSSLKPEDIERPASMAEGDHAEREHLRQYLSERFNRQRNASKVKGYNAAFGRVKGLMRSDHLFDIEREPQSVRDRYGKTEFAQHAIIARRLIEAGVPMVKVARAWWDTHTENFESHRELCTELDHVMSTLLLDLKERGLLEDTLVITLGEFGRTPSINKDLGRDHFASAWSCSLSGSGVVGGSVHGKTDAKGEKVVEGKVGPGDLLATIYAAAGIDPHKHYQHGLRPIPLSPEDAEVARTVIS